MIILRNKQSFKYYITKQYLVFRFTAGLATPPHKYITLTLASVAHNNGML